jgi:hypothetical protein
VLTKSQLEKGQLLFMTETPEGLLLTPCDAALDEQVQAGRSYMREFRGTYQQLEK